MIINNKNSNNNKKKKKSKKVSYYYFYYSSVRSFMVSYVSVFQFIYSLFSQVHWLSAYS